MGPAGGDMGRPARPGMGGGGRGKREPVTMPATEGQMTEIMRLAARLNLSTAQLETQFGRALADITRFDAREWIKQLREEAATKAPPSKIHFGQWPGLKDDLEAVYLNEQKEAAAPFRFVLFNGEALEGPISDFTPYTITIAEAASGNQIVLRKLAIAYYRRLGEGGTDGAAPTDGETTEEGEAQDNAPFPGSGQPQFAAPAAEPDSDAGGAA
jgi:sRNA-binding regulator protein Hfq